MVHTDHRGLLAAARGHALGGAFTWLAVALLRRRDRRSALRVYLSSPAYLALLFTAMVVDVHV